MDSDGEKNYFKISAVILVVVLVLAAVTWHWGRPVYRHHKEARNVTEAQAFLDRGDYRNAWLCASLARLLNPNNVPACRILAAVAEAAHSPAALDLRQQIVELEPTVENKLALATTGLQFQNPPFPLTTQILDQLATTAANLTAYHVVATMVALKMNRVAEAEIHMAAASQLEPTNHSFQMNLAVLRLNSTNPAVLNDARATLKRLITDPGLGLQALRSLVAECVNHNDPSGALDYSTQLLSSPQANLADRLQHLGILKRLQSPDLTAQLSAVQQATGTNAALAAQTASWMEANGFMSETLTWLNTLPASVQTQPPVQLVLVDYYTGINDWQGLCRLTAKGDWGEMNFLRLAFLSHAWSELGEQVVADANWKSAVNQSGDKLGALNALLQLADRWQMNAEDLLWRIVRKYPDAGWAQQNLERHYLTAGNTRKLYQFYAECLARSPQNVALKNNLAATALLLKTNLTQASQWVADLYARQTNDPVIVSTYAYALHLQGRDREGLAAFQQLQPAQLEQPSVALYYGVLLAASGDHAKATPFLAIAEKEEHLLPEEKQLLKTETLKR
ncbi:MAG TPA: hypothetical protein VNN22_09565 [Verrucomicrobiae bacterium]|nr:hypothetical protein [Verrucomicrobiae bacterium]